MPTYLELNQEEWYRDEFEPPALADFNNKLRTFYGHDRTQTGSKGDNRHLRGRHRSINWDLNSIYCTNRSYGTTDQRDRRGDWDALRATDIGIKDATLRAACKRLDEAVKAGRLLGLAEWFGTVDGVNVVGWFQGHPSSSDDSHLWHLHVGYWTEHADDAELFALLFDVITGGDVSAEEVWQFDVAPGPATYSASGALYTTLLRTGQLGQMAADITALKQSQATQDSKLDAILAKLDQGGGSAGAVDLTPSALNEIRDVVDQELDEAFSGGADKDTP